MLVSCALTSTNNALTKIYVLTVESFTEGYGVQIGFRLATTTILYSLFVPIAAQTLVSCALTMY